MRGVLVGTILTDQCLALCKVSRDILIAKLHPVHSHQKLYSLDADIL